MSSSYTRGAASHTDIAYDVRTIVRHSWSVTAKITTRKDVRIYTLVPMIEKLHYTWMTRHLYRDVVQRLLLTF